MPDFLSQRRGRRNPTAISDRSAFGAVFAYGYRARHPAELQQPDFRRRWQLAGDLRNAHGKTPGIAGSVTEGRRQIIAGVSFDYLSAFQGELRYTWFTGGGKRDLQRDRDNLQFFLGYQF